MPTANPLEARLANLRDSGHAGARIAADSLEELRDAAMYMAEAASDIEGLKLGARCNALVETVREAARLYRESVAMLTAETLEQMESVVADDERAADEARADEAYQTAPDSFRRMGVF